MQGKFELNGKAVVVTGVSPTMTVLEWLRATGRTGTKEGCAEGDCGACTIAILENEDVEKPSWRCVCSCILLLPQIFGRTVVSVEGLAQGSLLHPAQTALVDALGSQCGYCTPGFVMSLFEATYRDDLEQDWQKDDQICGNLCRCTGYRPIRDALETVAGSRPSDRFAQALGESVEPQAIVYQTEEQSYVRPTDWHELWSALAHDDVRIVNGATDLGLHVTQRHQHFKRLVDLGSMSTLREIEDTGDSYKIGASVTLSDLEAWSNGHLPALEKMLRFFASRQIKNRATIAGNLCNASPIGDLPPVMLGLDAVALIQSKEGQRRIPFGGADIHQAGFWTAYRETVLKPGEILAYIEIPKPHAHTYVSSYKVSKRRELDISAVSSTFALRLNSAQQVEHVRLAYGGMAATPLRAYAVEQMLLDQVMTQSLADEAAEAIKQVFTPMDDHRGSAWYRTTVATNLLRGFFLEFQQCVPVGLPDRPSGTILSGGAP